jgi:hypothetical protein
VALLSVLTRHAYCPVHAVPTATFSCVPRLFQANIHNNNNQLCAFYPTLQFSFLSTHWYSRLVIPFYVKIRYQYSERVCHAAHTHTTTTHHTRSANYHYRGVISLLA